MLICGHTLVLKKAVIETDILGSNKNKTKYLFNYIRWTGWYCTSPEKDCLLSILICGHTLIPKKMVVKTVILWVNKFKKKIESLKMWYCNSPKRFVCPACGPILICGHTMVPKRTVIKTDILWADKKINN